VVERTEVERPDPDGAPERHAGDRDPERGHGGDEADAGDQQEDQEPRRS
jgi:hypothetical protein